MLIDSHCHLDKLELSKYQGDLHLALVKATEAGVGYFLCPGIDLDSFPNVLRLTQQYENVVGGVGLHPSEKIGYDLRVEELCQLADNPKIVAIGETGLDYYYATSEEERNQQKQRLLTHIRAAHEMKKPLIIHSRSAAEDIIDILRSESLPSISGVMHCFTESWEMAQQFMDLGFYISFSGIITFKNADVVRQVAKQVPLDRLLLETDAPYLAPVPYRGKPNEPAYLRQTAEALAVLRDISYANLATITSENFFRLFSCPSSVQKP